jgi:hypothetical protein
MAPVLRVPALTVTARVLPLPPKLTGAVPKLRSLLPVKVKSAFQICGFWVVETIAAPLVLSMRPPAMVNAPGPLPKAVGLLRLRVPASSRKALVKELSPASVSAPLPVFVNVAWSPPWIGLE